MEQAKHTGHFTDKRIALASVDAPLMQGFKAAALITLDEAVAVAVERDTLRSRVALLEGALRQVIDQRHDATVTLAARADEMVRLANNALKGAA